MERVEDRRLLAADLALNVTDANASVAPGATVAYQFEYSNVGDEAANGSIRTYVPRNTSLAEEGSTEGWTCEESRWGTACTLDVGEVAAEGSGSATLAVTVNEDVSARTRQIAIRGSISGDEIRRDRNDSDWSVTPVIQQLPDLQLEMSTGEQEEVAPGDTIVYSLDYANGGVVASPEAAITVNVPRNGTLAEGSSEGWVCEESVCTLTLGEVAPEAAGQATLAITLDAETPTTVRSANAFARIGGPDVTDANRWNNYDLNRVKVVHQVPDLSVELSDGDVESVETGGSLAYTVNYANKGLVDAAAVTLSVRLPSGTTLASEGSTEGWTCEEGVCTLDVGSVAKEATGSATLAVTLDAELNSRRLYARAAIADDGAAGDDANPRDNSDRVRTTVVGIEQPDRGRFSFFDFFSRFSWGRTRARA